MSRVGPANAITWKNLSPVSQDPGTAIPGSRLTWLAQLSRNREVDFYGENSRPFYATRTGSEEGRLLSQATLLA